MENVKTSVPNKIVGDNGSSYDSIRKMAKVLHVDRKRIRRDINDKGYFEHKGIVYSCIGDKCNDSTKVVVVE